MKTYQKVLVSVATVILCLLLIVGGIAVYVGRLFMPQVQAAQSITTLSDRVYTMTYRGDYGFDAFLEAGGASSDEEMATFILQFLSHGFAAGATGDVTGDAGVSPAVMEVRSPCCTNKEEEEFPHGCSTLVRQTADGVMMGRNYDFDHSGATMITLTYPDNGYASIATNSMEFLGLPANWKPSENVMENMAAIAAIYVPMDGMNEKGLCVADLIDLDGEQVSQDTGKPDLTTVSGIRLLLDKAATVEEAINLLEQYDMHSSIGFAHHYAVSDTTGRAVVIEYVDGQMVVNESPLCTNFNLCHARAGREFDMQVPGIPSAVERMEKLQATDEATSIVEALKEVSFSDWTQWSILFDTRAKVANYYFHADFDTVFPISL
ncbi:MAG: linear amide C-N hydrolase [Paludibacteraceae bacterium]|nr:linear amide C-N hydrolase [Paludibacteraceae bacterium]